MPFVKAHPARQLRDHHGASRSPRQFPNFLRSLRYLVPDTTCTGDWAATRLEGRCTGEVIGRAHLTAGPGRPPPGESGTAGFDEGNATQADMRTHMELFGRHAELRRPVELVPAGGAPSPRPTARTRPRNCRRTWRACARTRTSGQSGGGAVITVAVAGRLPDGVYTVAWQAVSADGDPVSAAFTFAVGPAPASLSAASAAPPATPGRWWLAAARWVLFAALAMALGGLAGHALARRNSAGSPRPLPPPWALRASLAGLAAAVLLAVLQLGGGRLTSGLARPSVSRPLSNRPGAVPGAEMLAFA